MPEIDLGSVVGPQGAPGATGPKGEQGAQGPAGLNATINGKNVLNILAGDNIEIQQSGDDLTLNAVLKVLSVNGQTGEITLSAYDVGALPTTGGTLTGDLLLDKIDAYLRFKSQQGGGNLLGLHWFGSEDGGNTFGVYDEKNKTHLLRLYQRSKVANFIGDIQSNDGWRHPLIQTGEINIAPTAANTPTAGALTFPKTFPGVPKVYVTVKSGAPGTEITGVGANQITAAGCNIYVTRTSTTLATLQWLAVY